MIIVFKKCIVYFVGSAAVGRLGYDGDGYHAQMVNLFCGRRKVGVAYSYLEPESF